MLPSGDRDQFNHHGAGRERGLFRQQIPKLQNTADKSFDMDAQTCNVGKHYSNLEKIFISWIRLHVPSKH